MRSGSTACEPLTYCVSVGLVPANGTMNQEFLVGARHQRASITSLPFVHTARRYYRLSVPVRCLGDRYCVSERFQTRTLRGSISRNKVSVGEPAEGSLMFCVTFVFFAKKLKLFVNCYCN
jgi:hypothetical protein